MLLLIQLADEKDRHATENAKAYDEITRVGKRIVKLEIKGPVHYTSQKPLLGPGYASPELIFFRGNFRPPHLLEHLLTKF